MGQLCVTRWGSCVVGQCSTLWCGGTVAVGNWWYWVSRGHLCLYILHKVEIWTGVTHALRTDGQTLKDRATQLLIKYKSGALVTQYCVIWWDMKPLSHFNNLQKVSPRNVWSRPLAPTPGPGKPNAYFAFSLSAWLVSNYFPAKVFANCLLMRIL